MSAPSNANTSGFEHPMRSAAAIFAGFVTVVVLSLVTDQLLHVVKIYPPWGVPMRSPALNILALTYRVIYAVVGSYLTARMAPSHPMRHALIGGAIGQIFSLAGAVIAVAFADLGPKWYPIALAATAMPSAWLGGILQRRGARA